MLISNIRNSHRNTLNSLFKDCHAQLTIASPYLASKMGPFLESFDFSMVQQLTLITTFKECDPEQLTKPEQLKAFISHFEKHYPNTQITIHVNNQLHGKLYITETAMLITSANFTENGMTYNHEWGMLTQCSSAMEEAHNELLETIDYADVTKLQIERACLFSEQYKKLNPEWLNASVPNSDILAQVYSDIGAANKEIKYFLKPIGHTDKPIQIEDRRDFSKLHQDLHFSKKRPKGVGQGDIVITTAIGAGSLLGYFRITGTPHQITEEQLKREPHLERWPWYIEARNQNTSFGKNWWIYDLKRSTLLEKYHQLFPDNPVTQAGGKTLNTLNRGNDKVQLKEHFALFLIQHIDEAL